LRAKRKRVQPVFTASNNIDERQFLDEICLDELPASLRSIITAAGEPD
jgi:hypothetical protein